MSGAEEKGRLALRAHHLLCLHGFRGLGYDERFVENMAEIRDRLRRKEALEIIVTDEPDEICEFCPHKLEDCCGREEPGSASRSKALDHRVLEWLGIKPGESFAHTELVALVQSKITPDDLAILCEGCEWLPFEYCAEGLRDKSLKSDDSTPDG